MYTLYIEIIKPSDESSESTESYEYIKNFYNTFSHNYYGDCGIDLCIPNTHIINVGEKKKIGHGVNMKMCDEMGRDVSYFLYARSSISKTPLIVHNSVGIIDAGYRGEICGAVINLMGPEYTINRYDRLFQICAPNLGNIKVEVVDKLDSTARGGGGFGSTGK